MRRIFNTFVILIIFCTLFVFLPVANANSVDLQIEINPETVYKGDLFTVTVTFTSNGEAIDALQASFKYDADRMEYVSGGGNAAEFSNGSGGISGNGSETDNTMVYNLRFRALKTGKANFAVTGSEIIGFISGMNLGNPTLRKSVEILKIQNQDGKNESTDPIEITYEGKKYYIARDLINVDLPQGFEIQELTYNGSKIQAAFNPASGLAIFYLMDEFSYGNFYIYDSQSNSFYPFINITTDATYIILTPDAVPKGYTLSTAEIGGKKVPACVPDKQDTALYLLYALNSSGVKGFYFYDTADGTLQRVVLQTVSVPVAEASVQTSEPTVNVEDVQNAGTPDNGEILSSLYIMTGACVVLAFLMVCFVFSIKSKKAKSAHINNNY